MFWEKIMHRDHILTRSLALAALSAGMAIVLLMAAIIPAQAQEAPPPDAEIVAVDTDNFPEVAVEVRMEGVQSQDAVRAELLEDGVPQTLLSAPSAVARKPVNIGLLLDISNQAYKDTYGTQFSTWLRALLDQAALIPFQDKIALFTPDGSGASLRSDIGDVLPEQDRWVGYWVEDHNRVLNLALNENFNSIAPPTTALSKLIRDAIGNFPQEAAASNQLIVFTGSIDKAGTDNFDDLEAACSANDVQVHAVMVSPEDTANRARMQTITDRCNGTLVDLTDAPDATDPLIRTIIADWQQQMDMRLRYRSRQAQPRAVTVRVPLPSETPLEASGAVDLAAAPAPPAVTVELPSSAAGIAEGAPALININWSLANYPLRTVTISYTVKPLQTAWTAVTLPAGAIGQGAIPIEVPAEALQSGMNSVEVRVADELGLQGEGAIQVRVGPPQDGPGATPTPESPAPPPPGRAGLPWEYLLALLLIAAAGALGFWLLRPPSAPVLSAPADKSFVDDKADVTLKWQPARRAVAYRAEITHGNKSPIVCEWQLALELPLGKIGGDTYWRVQARNRFSHEGKWSAAWKINCEPGTDLPMSDSAGTSNIPRLVRESKQNIRVTHILLADTRGEPRSAVAIGRSPIFADQDALLEDPSVSRAHCRIRYRQGSYYIHDEYGNVGTVVNGQKVGGDGYPLKHGDRIKLGDVIFRFDAPANAIDGNVNSDDLDRTEKSNDSSDPDRTVSLAS
jgi:pSer/pThr/pTyr-binding forkhead associated (FHA) protein